ncbi:MAG: imidazolonepropionase [Marinifilaceae bacterium]|jgi:imidazolonepropionase|nr:imidazolonepropionase [Marinifilaceae bacterium]
MNLLIKNIKKLVQVEENPVKWVAGKDMANLNCIDNAYLLVKEDKIEDFGSMDNIPDFDNNDNFEYLQEIDATGRMILPSYCDSHTHLVYAGSREIEYTDKIKGLSYEEIAKRGGGILNSSKLMEQASEDELYEAALDRIKEIISLGTGAVEIKSGYGLSPETEIKMLRVIKRLKETTPITIKATFLGAHAFPAEYKNGREDEYVDLIINEMIPMVASEELADYIDVFCDKGFFTVEQTDRILNAGMKYGLRPKIHANELDYSGGIQVGVKYNALSVDHLEYVGEKEIECLKNSETMPTVLPGAAFFLNMVCSPVRDMMNAGLPVALASDFNPGSSPSGNMKFVMSLACVNYKMLPQEAINACTINTAYAMGLEKTHGSIAKGKIANFYITKEIPSIEYLPYAYGSQLVDQVILNGEII